MSQPWEDYGPAKEEGPWADYKADTPVTKYKIGVEGLPDAVKAVAGDFHPLTQMAVGAKGLWDNAAIRAKQFFGQMTPEDETTVKANRALWEASRPAMAGAAVTGAAVPLGGVYKAGSAVAKAIPVVGGLVAPIAGGATAGAAFNGVTNPVLNGESEADNLKSGAIGGAIGSAATTAVSRLARPIMANPDVQALLNANIVPSIGQAGGKVWNALEEKAGSLPLVGDVTRWARNRAVQDLNRAAIQRAAPEVTNIGREGIGEAERSIGALYDKAVPQITVKADSSFIPHLESFADNKTLVLSPDQRASIKNFIRDNVQDHISNGQIAGPMAKKLDSLLGSTASSLRGSPNPSDRAAASAYQDAQAALKSAMEQGAATPEVSAMLKDANQKWAQLVRLQTAGAADRNGDLFTPRQLQGAVRANDKTLRKGQFAKGDALMQDLSDPAARVLGDKIPNSGTADRFLLSEGALGGGALLLGHPGITAAIAGAPLLYSRPVQKYLLGGYPGQQDLSNAILNMRPQGALAGAVLNQ